MAWGVPSREFWRRDGARRAYLIDEIRPPCVTVWRGCRSCLRRHNGGHSLDDDFIPLIGTDRVKFDDVLFRYDLTDRAGRRDGVSNMDGPGKLQFLAEVDGPGAGQLHAQDCRNEAGAQDTVGDPAAEGGLAGRDLIGVGGV